MLLNLGGNKRFKEFLLEYQVPKNAVFEFKYMIKASEYYRQLLKAELKSDSITEKPDLIEGLEMMDFQHKAICKLYDFIFFK